MKYVALTLYSETPHRWRAYATTFLKRLAATRVPEGWTILLFHDDTVSSSFIEHLRTRYDARTRDMTSHPLCAAKASWRFLAHDEPDTDVYYCMDLDSAFYKRDLACMRKMDTDSGVDGVVGRPTWYLGDSSEVSTICAGAFGLRPRRFAFRMSDLLAEYVARHTAAECERYFFDEWFLHHMVRPLLEKHHISYTTISNTGATGVTTRVVQKYLKFTQ